MTGNVLTQNENTAAEINLTGTDSSLTGQVYAKDGAAITLNVDPKTGSTATVTGSGLADGTDSVMTVNANNAVLNGGYYALDGGTTTVTLTGNSVQTAPEKTSGFSAMGLSRHGKKNRSLPAPVVPVSASLFLQLRKSKPLLGLSQRKMSRAARCRGLHSPK